MSEEVKKNDEILEESGANQAAEETMDDYADQLDQDPVWNTLKGYLEDQTVLTVEIGGIVKSGVVAYVEGVRGFIPASQLALGYVEDLESWLGKTIQVVVITAEPAEKRLVLSGKKVAQKEAQEQKKAKIAACKVGTVLEGKVESVQTYGAFVDIGDGLTGLVHISQLSQKRVKTPGEVVKVGDVVKTKIIGIKDGKISLSMKALQEGSYEAKEEVYPYKEEGKASTSLGSLLKGIKLD